VILVEFSLDYPILRETLETVPDARLVWERSDASDEHHVILCWLEAASFVAVGPAFEDDRTVDDWSLLTELPDRRLYRVELADPGYRASLYPAMVEESGVNRRVVADAEGWHLRVEFPTVAAFERFRDACRAQGVDIRLDRFLTDSAGDDREFGLTPAQREILVAAVETGYLDIPREADLAGLADELGISPNAASERFRRAVAALTRSAICECQN
jgi:hypothetical protein